jgi:hypothetical protein
MMLPLRFDTHTALEYADQDRLEEWIHSYLTTGSWQNPGLSAGLKLQRRWWHGPVQLPLSAVARCVGTEAGMEYEVSQVYWEKRMTRMIESIQSSGAGPLDMPPLIATYDPDLATPTHLSVRDGNHRLGAYERLGWPSTWVLIWFNTEEEYKQGLAPINQAANLYAMRSQPPA